jgi:tetratricopeptide (TPR) repeat protein
MSDTFDEFWKRGLELYYAGKLEEAIAEWREANRLDPVDGDVPYKIAIALLELGRNEDAVTVIRAALRLSPDSADLYALQGRQLYVEAIKSGDKSIFREALASVQTALQIRPDNAYALYMRGVLEWRLGQKRKAIETLKASIKRDPTDLYVYITLYEFQCLAFHIRGFWQTFNAIDNLPESKELARHYERIRRLSRRLEFDLGIGVGIVAVLAAFFFYSRRQQR